MILIRFAVGLLFLVSGWEKLTQPYQNFLYVVESYEVFSPEVATYVARTVPWVEFISGVFLILGLHLKTALGTLWAFNSGLIGVVSQAMIRGLNLEECGCFGSLIHLSLTQVLILDVVLWVLFGALWLKQGNALMWSLDKLLDK